MLALGMPQTPRSGSRDNLASMVAAASSDAPGLPTIRLIDENVSGSDGHTLDQPRTPRGGRSPERSRPGSSMADRKPVAPLETSFRNRTPTRDRQASTGDITQNGSISMPTTPTNSMRSRTPERMARPMTPASVGNKVLNLTNPVAGANNISLRNRPSTTAPPTGTPTKTA
mmetsp:Transcript_8027/g.12918  ORF Transcript_8027/g.12918 Transcript_8027/m.12918 type:complete len:171 (-) Transcript_8027:511-1023(-)